MLVRCLQTTAAMLLLGLWTCAPAGAAGYETLVLKDGQRVTGEVVAEKQNALYVDLGYDLLRVPRDQVTSRSKVNESTSVVKTGARGDVVSVSSSILPVFFRRAR